LERPNRGSGLAAKTSIGAKFRERKSSVNQCLLYLSYGISARPSRQDAFIVEAGFQDGIPGKPWRGQIMTITDAPLNGGIGVSLCKTVGLPSRSCRSSAAANQSIDEGVSITALQLPELSCLCRRLRCASDCLDIALQ